MPLHTVLVLMRTADVRMKSRVVEIVDIVSLKFASDEATEWQVGKQSQIFAGAGRSSGTLYTVYTG